MVLLVWQHVLILRWHCLPLAALLGCQFRYNSRRHFGTGPSQKVQMLCSLNLFFMVARGAYSRWDRHTQGVAFVYTRFPVAFVYTRYPVAFVHTRSRLSRSFLTKNLVPFFYPWSHLSRSSTPTECQQTRHPVESKLHMSHMHQSQRQCAP